MAGCIQWKKNVNLGSFKGSLCVFICIYFAVSVEHRRGRFNPTMWRKKAKPSKHQAKFTSCFVSFNEYLYPLFLNGSVVTEMASFPKATTADKYCPLPMNSTLRTLKIFTFQFVKWLQLTCFYPSRCCTQTSRFLLPSPSQAVAASKDNILSRLSRTKPALQRTHQRSE